MPTYQDLGYAMPASVVRDRSRAVFGQVMGLVAFTLAFAALGAYITRDSTQQSGFLYLIGWFACIIGLNAATRRGHERLATGLLFGLGLLMGMFIGPLISYYASTQPAVVWQAAGATGGFVAAAGAYGYATRRDLSHWARGLFWALIGLLVFGLVAMLVSIPHGHVIWALLGLVVFGGFTILDFNRLQRANMASAVPIAASIFLDVFNIFLFMLSLFGGGGRRS
jgi:modulator of FtsH protease